jgi:hypothetical protein
MTEVNGCGLPNKYKQSELGIIKKLIKKQKTKTKKKKQKQKKNKKNKKTKKNKN